MSLFLTLALPFSARADRACARIYAKASVALMSENLPLVLAHQNELRRQKKLPLLADKASETPTDQAPYFVVETPNAFPDEPIFGKFLIRGNALIRAVVNDIFGLNFVYEFAGARMLKPVPYSLWALRQVSGDSIKLYRQMSPRELMIWQNRNYDVLGSDWGHGTKVLHFSTDRNLTTAAGPADNPIVEINISKKALEELAAQNQLWSALLDEEKAVSEFVLPGNRLRSLVESGAVSVRLP